MTLSDPDPVNPCHHRLWDDIDGVRCIQEAGHRSGHTYISGDGSAATDRHTEAQHD